MTGADEVTAVSNMCLLARHQHLAEAERSGCMILPVSLECCKQLAPQCKDTLGPTVQRYSGPLCPHSATILWASQCSDTLGHTVQGYSWPYLEIGSLSIC
eukprot:365005-Chlamydomonas_euryale.AAC.4